MALVTKELTHGLGLYMKTIGIGTNVPRLAAFFSQSRKRCASSYTFFMMEFRILLNLTDVLQAFIDAFYTISYFINNDRLHKFHKTQAATFFIADTVLNGLNFLQHPIRQFIIMPL